MHKLIPGVFRKMSQKGYESNDKYHSDEKTILKHFIQEASVFNEQFPPEDRFHWVQLAQHYGVPTRLLDWTNNPLVALFFACEKQEEEDGVVWVLHKKRYYEFSTQNEGLRVTVQDMISKMLSDEGVDDVPQYPFLFTPYYFDHRMSAQSSWFMAWGKDTNSLDEILKNHIMELPDVPTKEILKREIHASEILANNTKKECISPIYIKGEHKDLIIEELNNLGINEKTLFPGIEGVGKYIEHRYNEDVR